MLTQMIEQYGKNVSMSIFSSFEFGSLMVKYESPLLGASFASIKDDIDIEKILCPEIALVGFLDFYSYYIEFLNSSPSGESKKIATRIFKIFNRLESELADHNCTSELLVHKIINFCCKHYKIKKPSGALDKAAYELCENMVSYMLSNLGDEKYLACIKYIFENTNKKYSYLDCYDFIQFTIDYISEMAKSTESHSEFETKYDLKDCLKIVSNITYDDDNSESVMDNSYYNELTKKLSSKVIAQNTAVQKFVQGLFKGRITSPKERKGPESTFLLVGPPGVGKTYLAKCSAEALNRPFKEFNMSEYSGHQAHEQLIGSASIYSKSKTGVLTEYVHNHPNAVLLFDEIEKAHTNTLRLFISILEGGTLDDIHNEQPVDFSKTICIFTTNAGRQYYEDKRDVKISSLPERTLLDAIKGDNKNSNNDSSDSIPSEILSRLAKGNIIGFDHMSPDKLLPIIKENMRSQIERYRNVFNLNIEYDDSLLPYIFLYHMGDKLDARVASSRARSFIDDLVYSFLDKMKAADNAAENPTTVNIEVIEDEISKKYTSVPEQKKDIIFVSYRNKVPFFEPQASSLYNIHHSINDTSAGPGRQPTIEGYLNDESLDIAAIIIDPFMTRSGGLGEAVTEDLYERKTDGMEVLHWALEKKLDIPVYAVEIYNTINLKDRWDLSEKGVTDFLTVDITHANANEEISAQLDDIVFGTVLRERLDELTSRGRVLDFKAGVKESENGTSIRIHSFSRANAMNSEDIDVFVNDPNKAALTFDSIIGAENAKEELRHFRKFLTDQKAYIKSGLHVSRGILLYGPPGTGKTMLAKALASEADCPFIAATGAEFLNNDKSLSKVFATARKYAPSILFIDEIDAIAMPRNFSNGANPILNTLLTEMDGFESKSTKPVFVIAATNSYYDESIAGAKPYLDPAVLRRFSKHVYVDLPNTDERYEFLQRKKEESKNNTYNLNLLNDDDLKKLATISSDSSLDNLNQVIGFALGRAAEKDMPLTMDLLIECFEETEWGEKLNIAESHLLMTARHEAGHAFLHFYTGSAPEYATVVGRGNFLGLVSSKVDEEEKGIDKDDLLNKIKIKLAGKAAEMVFYPGNKGLSAGPSNDLEGATEYALKMLTSFGMYDDFLINPYVFGKDIMSSPAGVKYLEKTNDIIKEQLNETIEIVKQYKDQIDALAHALIEKSRLECDDMIEILRASGYNNL